MKVNDLSVKIVISTGRIVSWPCVRALNSLQKAMMLMPCGPSAVPTGGAGLAFPAGIWSFTKPDTFFATLPPYAYAQASPGSYYHSCFSSQWSATDGGAVQVVGGGSSVMSESRCRHSVLTTHNSPPTAFQYPFNCK